MTEVANGISFCSLTIVLGTAYNNKYEGRKKKLAFVINKK